MQYVRPFSQCHVICNYLTTPFLQSLCIKIRGIKGCHSVLGGSVGFSPKNLKCLKMKPILCSEALDTVKGLSSTSVDFSGKFCPPSSTSTLQKLSLLLDIISDELVLAIATKLPHLVELDLEDMPISKPLISHDLTDMGLQSLASCCCLKSLSLARSRQKCPVSFRRVSDMGIFLLSEGCRGLESIRLYGFCKVSDAGFTSILQSCQSLKKFEIRNAALLSDLAFHDLTEAPCSLSELRLRSCNLITSESMKKLACYSSLELLDLGGCWSIADPGIPSISSLCRLTTLDLAGADITDTSLSALGQGTSPIKSLSLRGCKRVTDRGISHLLQSGGIINSTLSSLDLGSMPGISDLAISTVGVSCVGITELCIRSCFYVTDSSIEALSKRGSPPLRKLDLYNCSGLSRASLECFRKPSFGGLWWLGVGATLLSNSGSEFSEMCGGVRPWLTFCTYGCEMGCHDGWQFHQRARSVPASGTWTSSKITRLLM
ncbi:hypothetical protein SAY86_031231 [Trapa natans]|uniref:F-box/LRR-repeat protein 15-like leucin rich repeat domain-containing protein n=1 Tax=Trapa natans TaxID=22666 RepID=A0AAN7R9H5_TRANT|nr:hypothetical protein SAY86_031231 [Trapa natans]